MAASLAIMFAHKSTHCQQITLRKQGKHAYDKQRNKTLLHYYQSSDTIEVFNVATRSQVLSTKYFNIELNFKCMATT